MTRKEELEIIINSAQAELIKLNEPTLKNSTINLSDITIDEKVSFFNDLYREMYEIIELYIDGEAYYYEVENRCYNYGIGVLNPKDPHKIESLIDFHAT